MEHANATSAQQVFNCAQTTGTWTPERVCRTRMFNREQDPVEHAFISLSCLPDGAPPTHIRRFHEELKT
ncbi:hypothetical protein [Streptomyces sp. Tu 4128]|uniref:hypothetical protein n=1 Tax=Streptomyces sp. Tu 4128 TaxID=1120314 RepID=UPI0019D21C44|nr:hypothetical protein [Streptomyces sp. Tu 4128]